MDRSSDDEELMLAYQNGDSRAFDFLYERHSGKVYAYLRKRIKRQELVDECFQMAFAKFHKSRAQYDPAFSVQQWLYVIAKTTLLDVFRKQTRELKIDDDTSVEELEVHGGEPTPSSEEPAISLDQLSAQQKQVVQWRVFDEISYDEIAKRLNQSEPNIRQIFSRALKKLRSGFIHKEGRS